jgi:cell division protein FtsL
MTGTIVIIISVIALLLSIIAIYFYDKKLMREISEYEKKMYKKKKGNG